jgi:hypothetical protein
MEFDTSQLQALADEYASIFESDELTEGLLRAMAAGNEFAKDLFLAADHLKLAVTDIGTVLDAFRADNLDQVGIADLWDLLANSLDNTDLVAALKDFASSGDILATNLLIAGGYLREAADALIQSFNLEAIVQQFQDLLDAVSQLDDFMTKSLTRSVRDAAMDAANAAGARQFSQTGGRYSGEISYISWRLSRDIQNQSVDLEIIGKLQRAGAEFLELLDTYAHARMEELQVELEYVESLGRIFEQLHGFATGILDQIDVLQRGPRAESHF